MMDYNISLVFQATSCWANLTQNSFNLINTPGNYFNIVITVITETESKLKGKAWERI